MVEACAEVSMQEGRNDRFPEAGLWESVENYKDK
jgi:hypothetical protein